MARNRLNDRRYDQMRACTLLYDQFSYAPGSVLFMIGNTKVLCTVSLQSGVPGFLRGKGTGWLTAEYALLPHATHVRTNRETSSAQRNGRTVEISRLIGRTLRTVVDLSVIGENTLHIDCDVLQADGGTRVASIIAAACALRAAEQKWLASYRIKKPFLKDLVVAVAVGVCEGKVILDPDYQEDTQIDADFNVIMTRSGDLIEIQGGAEKYPLSWELFDEVKRVALHGVRDMISIIDSNLYQQQSLNNQASKPVLSVDSEQAIQATDAATKTAFFSLGNRLVVK